MVAGGELTDDRVPGDKPGSALPTSPVPVSTLSVAIMTDETGWHTTRLRRALRDRGCSGRCVDLADCRFETTWAPHGLVIPGFGRSLPDAVIVRGIAGGTFEQVTLRLGILHALRTGFLLHRAGIATPPTWTGESAAHARRRLIREAAAGREVVLKPLFGSQGKGLQRLAGPPLPDLKAYGAVAHLQRFVPPRNEPAHDWRVLVVGGSVAAAMRRLGSTWIHNAAQGARCIGGPAPEGIAQLAIRACAAIGLDYAGVDLVPDDEAPEGARVLEVNGIAAWQRLQQATGVDVAGLLVDDLLGRKIPAVAAGRAA
jgi:tetrahydromethanopterin:alpha-L-glutamate ligase